MEKKKVLPHFIFESSWEVCNKVGGIYTVLSTRARTLKTVFGDNLIFIGPDCWQGNECAYFTEDNNLFGEWAQQALADGLNVRIGRWNIKGNPVAILVDFNPFFAQKDEIYSTLWAKYGVDSLHGYGDYDEASMFSYAAGRVVESFYKHNIDSNKRVIYHGNEWMTGLGLLYINNVLPQIATVFTTHATSIGRSIAGNNKPLYDYFAGYNGDQMAAELNMESKHSIEKQAAKYVDCFTTVSDITARECAQLLDKPVDVVLPNGFDDDIVPVKTMFNKKRKTARQLMFGVANALTGKVFDDKNTLIVSTSGRYEFRNKGIDVFIDAINRLRGDDTLGKKVLVYIEVPGWMDCARQDLTDRLAAKQTWNTPLEQPYITHWLHNMGDDKVLNMFISKGICNEMDDNITFIFVPCYLNGTDGIMNMEYYDLLIGNDITVYPSYYEPWGYTPLESIAFNIPCVCTDLSGFGLWANSVKGEYCNINDGVEVIHRTDGNYNNVCEEIRETILNYSLLNNKEVEIARNNATNLSKKALWSEFIEHYYTAYNFALCKAKERVKHNKK